MYVEFLKGSWLTDDSRRMAMKKTTTSHYFTKLMHFSDFYKQKKGGGGRGVAYFQRLWFALKTLKSVVGGRVISNGVCHLLSMPSDDEEFFTV